MTDLIPYLLFTIVLVTAAVIAGRAVHQSRMTKPVPKWISQQAEYYQIGEDYCELRADLNYTNDKPATSRVTAAYFSLADHRREVLSDRMTQSDFNQQRNKLKREGWRQVHSTVDREGQSYYFQRPSP